MACLVQRGKRFYIQISQNGKVRQHSLRTADRKVAKFRMNEIENRLALGDSYLPDRNLGVEQCFEEFKKSRDGVLAPKTTMVVNQRIEWFIKDTHVSRLKAITEDIVKQYLDRRIEGTKEVSGISPKTANHTIQQLGAFLNFCVRKKYINENPLRWMKRYRLPQKIPRFLSLEEAKALLERAKGSNMADIVYIAIFTGMRWGEISRLKMDDFDFTANEVIVRKSKTNKFRVIPLARELKEHLEHLDTKYLDVDMPHQTMNKRLTNIREDLKMPHFRFHDLRHTFASLSIKNGVDIYTLSKWLGHSTARTTELYAHLYNDHSQASMQKFQITTGGFAGVSRETSSVA